jgi:hypothetical protein
MYPGYGGPPVTAQNSGYGQFLPKEIAGESYTPHHEMAPPLHAEEENHQPKKN